MHVFDPELSLKSNSQKADDIEFAAWELAGHEHREEFRDSGPSAQRTAWLHAERIRMLSDALASGELLALGISIDDPNLAISRIPENLFLSGQLRIDAHSSTVSGLGRQFRDVRICRASAGQKLQVAVSAAGGRPKHLRETLAAWAELKSQMPGFLQMGKGAQNLEIREMVSKLFPMKFPGNARIGESTIRRHRRDHPDLFV